MSTPTSLARRPDPDHSPRRRLPASGNEQQIIEILDTLEKLFEDKFADGNTVEADLIREKIDALHARIAGHRMAAGQLPGSGDHIEINGIPQTGANIGGTLVARQLAGRDVVDATGGVYISHVEHYEGSGHVAQAVDKADLRHTYLGRLLNTANRVPLGQLDRRAIGTPDSVPEIRLETIYVPLDTTNQQPAVGQGNAATAGARVPVPVLAEIINHRRLVILGDPGSGKTTLMNCLTLFLAQAGLDPASGALERLNVPGGNGQRAATWRHDALMPVRVELSEFARDIPETTGRGTCELVWQHIAAGLASHGLADFAPEVKRLLAQGKCLVMFDGLDEVPDPARRKIVRDAVTDFADTYGESRFIVTCRVLSYTDPAWQLTSFPAVVLAPLSVNSINTFVDRWYSELVRLGAIDPQTALMRAAELRNAAANLVDLAHNPMLLTVMAVVHTYLGTLPRERARLYNDCVELLLWHWQRQKRIGPNYWQQGILDELETREERLVNGLCEVAFNAHRSQDDGDAPTHIPQKDVIDVLARYLDNDWGRAQRFCDYVEKEAGLLIGKGLDASGKRMYAFPHRGFQEFLAACHLISGWDFARRAADLAAAGDIWHEVLLLAVGHLVFNLHEVMPRPLDAINLLCKPEMPTTDQGWRSVWWAGEMLHIVGRSAVENDEHLGTSVVPRVIAHLAALVTGGHLTPVERAQAADVLGALGDPRPGVCTDTPEMVRIEGGQVEIGTEPERHTVNLKTFYLSRYPITNAQFQLFVNEGGYHNPKFWTGRGWEWRQHTGRRQGWLADPVWGLPNRPVVGLTWHEAVAYTRWLSTRTGHVVRLPTEPEWERAAAGTERRKYPWGSRTSDDTTNHHETGIGQTTAVGIFPADRTPEGIHDLGGNVWEWCSSLGAAYPYTTADGREDLEAGGPRILRGGAFESRRDMLHCTHRRPVDPQARVSLIGFRVALNTR